MKSLCSLLILIVVCAAPARAAEQQNHARIREVALAYARAQTQPLPGKVDVKVEDIDPRIVLPACAPLEAFLPSGSALIGKTSIGVRCNRTPGWSIYVQATIRVSTTVLVANRPLAQNTVLGAQDFSVRNGQLGQPGILTDPAQAIGKTLKFGIGEGQVLRADMVRAPFVVFQGKTTDVRVRSDGFSIQASGKALNNGADGQDVQVRMASGMVVSGLATADGSVEVRP
jgi:flagellar basal body P-ring formation protein FlgA